jgi:membrane protein DedA with SNARE-associated domain
MLIDLSIVIGAFIQDFIPFPSVLVFAPGAAALQLQGASIWHILALVPIIGVARVLAGLIIYWASDKLRDFLYTKQKSWFGIRQEQLKNVSKKLSNSAGWWAVFALWALPFAPSVVIPLSAGLVKLPLKTFITATYAGSMVNALTYLIIGYYGLQAILIAI